MSEHIVSSFDTDLEGLRSTIAEMGGIAEQMLGDAVNALVRRDGELAQTVITTDVRLDVLQRGVEERAIMTIARRQPLAVDLRDVVSAIRISGDIERIGDLAKNCAKRTLAITEGFQAQKIVVGVQNMCDLAMEQLKDVLDAYAGRDLERALDVWQRDGAIDALYTSLFRELLTYMMEDPRNISFCAHLLFYGKNIERIGDHTTNIAETIHFLVTGQPLLTDRPKGDSSSEARVELRASQLSEVAMAAILIVEDEEQLVLLLRYNLEAEGYAVDVAMRGDEAELKLKERLPDLVLLDWMLPGLSGIELCRRLKARPETERLPVIMLTARGEEEDRVRGLATGADDYIVKPFSVAELLARVRALLRRVKPNAVADLLTIGDVELDRVTHRVKRAGMDVQLGPTEFRLLAFLMRSPGRVFTRDQLLNGVWGHDAYIDERTVDVHVGRLRRAVHLDGKGDPIRTVRGAGYSFDETYR